MDEKIAEVHNNLQKKDKQDKTQFHLQLNRIYKYNEKTQITLVNIHPEFKGQALSEKDLIFYSSI